MEMQRKGTSGCQLLHVPLRSNFFLLLFTLDISKASYRGSLCFFRVLPTWVSAPVEGPNTWRAKKKWSLKISHYVLSYYWLKVSASNLGFYVAQTTGSESSAHLLTVPSEFPSSSWATSQICAAAARWRPSCPSWTSSQRSRRAWRWGSSLSHSFLAWQDDRVFVFSTTPQQLSSPSVLPGTWKTSRSCSTTHRRPSFTPPHLCMTLKTNRLEMEE